ncbi:MAG: hypothetical protein V4560_09685 [Bacteroidota bacterium]
MRPKRVVIMLKLPVLEYFAKGDTVDDLKKSIKSGIECYFENTTEAPSFAHIHFVKDEIMVL